MEEDDINEKFSSETHMKVYPKRWLVLVGLCLLNFCGALNWLTFSTVPYSAADFYDTGLGAINLLSLIFMFSALPVGTFATFLIERYGLRLAFLFCGWTTCVGSIIRVFSVVGDLGKDGQMTLLFIGQAIIALGQPFSTYCPAKTAEAWFAEEERTVVNLIGTVANPVGVVVVGLISPLFEHDGGLDATGLLLTMAVPSALTAIFVTLTMTSPVPPTPPSAVAAKETEDFRQILNNVKTILSDWKYLILLVSVGGSLGIYSSFVTLISQILCPYGYSTAIAGLCSALLTIMGVVGGAPIGRYVDKTQQFSSVLKFSYSAVVAGLAMFSGLFHIYMGYYIVIIICGIGVFAFAILPVGMELAAEVTYPVGVATSSGLIVLSGQLQGLILILVMQAISFPLSLERTCQLGSVCSEVSCNTTAYEPATTPLLPSDQNDDDQITYDYSYSIYFCTSWMAAICIVLVAFFRPEYRRREAERMHMSKNMMGNDAKL